MRIGTMCHSKFKVLISTATLLLVFWSCSPIAGASEQVNVSSNAGGTYLELSSNQTSTASTTLRQYAILNESSTLVVDTSRPERRSLRDNTDDSQDKHNRHFAQEIDVNPSSVETYLERSSIVFGMISAANDSKISFSCYRQLQQIRKSILRKEPWALKVLDASGSKTSGFVLGHNYWLGNRDACNAVLKPVSITLSRQYHRIMDYAILTERAPFDMSYRVAYVSHHSPWQVEVRLMSEKMIHIGLCLPSSCSSSEIHQLTADYVAGDLFVDKEIYDFHPQVMYTKDLKLTKSFYERKSLKIICFSVMFTLLMMLAASFMRVKSLIVAELIDGKSPILSDPSNGASISATDSGRGNDIATDSADDEGFIEKIKETIKCFDVQTNFEKLFRVQRLTRNEIPVINGMRSLSSFWIMLFHVPWYMYFTVNNKPILVSDGETLAYQIIYGAPLLVDVFFSISGFLQVYNFMRNTTKMETIRNNGFAQNAWEFLKSLFHRYLRLAPLYLIITTAVELHAAYSEDVSVYHIFDRNDQWCSQNWWRNVLFIQNLFDLKDMCVNWSWSLACEMQFFIITTILLFVYTKKPQLVKVLVSALLVFSTIWSFTVGINENFQFSIDSVYETGSRIYINPIVRILPYIIGAAAARYFVENKFKVDISYYKERSAWNTSIVVFILCIYTTLQRGLPSPFTTFLLIFGRFCFAVAMSWIIIGSATGRSIWWSRLLESKICQQVNRVTYAIYLVNPFVISFAFSLTDASTHAEPVIMSMIMIGLSIIVYITSIVFTLAFEMPYANISSMLLKRNKIKKA